MLKKILNQHRSHKHYYEVQASCFYELGQLEAQTFFYQTLDFLEYERRKNNWKQKVKDSTPYLLATEQSFPNIFEELRGQADALKISINELFALVIEDELDAIPHGKCTSLVSKQGHFVAHNEDWDMNSKDSISILKRTVAGTTTLELFYTGTLGGNSISINSHGIVQTINSLSHKDHQVGVPKSIIARYLSQTSNPANDIKMISSIPRSSGFHHLLFSIKNRQCWSWECSAKKNILTIPSLPFAHTNHYLSQLKSVELYKNIDFSHERFAMARNSITGRSIASINNNFQQAKTIMSNTSQGVNKSILNNRTIAQVVIDVDTQIMYISLAREKNKGWVQYPLNFI